MKEYNEAQKKAVEFLESFTASDFKDEKLHAKFRAYKGMHKKGTLTKGSYETILEHLGFEKVEHWKEPEKPSPFLIDILT